MRFTVTCKLDSPFLPVDYRRGFASLIKEALQRANSYLFQRYYAQVHVLKPFTFSVYFPGLRGQRENDFEVGEKAILHFSTSSPELAATVYNGLRSIRSYTLFHNTLTVQSIHLERRVVIREPVAVFKTMAPVLVNRHGNANWYLLPGDPGFDEGLRFAISEVVRLFLERNGANVELHPLQCRRKVVRHYNMHMRGFVGLFELRGSPDVLNLIYQIGLGVRRSQGFGMLELVQQGSWSQPAVSGGAVDE